MKHQTQPAYSRLCGQTCVAMILGVTIDEAVDLVGKRGGTYTKDLRIVLEKHGYKCSPRLKRGFPKDDGLYIMKVKFKGQTQSHWVVYIIDGEDKIYHDPELQCGTPELIHGYVSSYMLLKKV